MELAILASQRYSLDLIYGIKRLLVFPETAASLTLLVIWLILMTVIAHTSFIFLYIRTSVRTFTSKQKTIVVEK